MAQQLRRVSVPDDAHEQTVPEERIRNRAHAIYEERGAAPGRDVDDWLQAERELRSQRKQGT